MFLFPIRPSFLHLCATCSELPSNMKTLNCLVRSVGIKPHDDEHTKRNITRNELNYKVLLYQRVPDPVGDDPDPTLDKIP